jgi:hypothetical protein
VYEGGLVKPCEAWTGQDLARAQLEVARLLRRVGRGEQIVEMGWRAMHVRRLVSEEEMKVVGPATDVRVAR